MRVASLATWSACRRSIARLGVPTRGRGPVADRPLISDRLAGDESIPPPPDGGDDAGSPVAADRVGGERDAGRGRLDHSLDHDRHPSVTGGLVPGDPRGVTAGQDTLSRGEDVIGGNAEHRLEHAGIRPLGAVLGDAARANRKRSVAEALHAPRRSGDCARRVANRPRQRSARRLREPGRPWPSALRDWPPCPRPRRHRPFARREAIERQAWSSGLLLACRGDRGLHEPVDVVHGLIDGRAEVIAPHAKRRR